MHNIEMISKVAKLSLLIISRFMIIIKSSNNIFLSYHYNVSWATCYHEDMILNVRQQRKMNKSKGPHKVDLLSGQFPISGTHQSEITLDVSVTVFTFLFHSKQRLCYSPWIDMLQHMNWNTYVELSFRYWYIIFCIEKIWWYFCRRW